MNGLLVKTKDEIVDNNNKIELSQQQKKEYKLLGSVSMNRGHILFEYNGDEGTIERADFILNDTIIVDKVSYDVSHNYRVNVKKNCFYFQALNMKNAEKKIIKLGYPVFSVKKALKIK